MEIYREKGITLIALVITVILMLILAGVAISALTGDGGLFDKTRGAAEAFENASQKEAKQIEDLMNEIDGYIAGIPEKPDKPTDPEPEEPTDPDKLTPEELLTRTNGSWNGTINTPKLSTGMIPVYWNESGEEIQLTSESLRTEWDSWHNYVAQTGSTATAGSGTSKWANAVTKDSNGNITGYWVWIPRYEYKLTTSTKTIDVNFIARDVTTPSTGYKIHPVFMNDTDKGGWDSEIPGFWVAKYSAGYQASTVNNDGNLINSSDAVVYSNLKYSNPGNEYTNALGQNVTTTNYSSISISYPVFKPLTYSYNCINIDGMYRISQKVKSATDFYGLSNSTDSHLMKNSEWGAVVYLSWSKYGRNGVEPNINNVNLNNKDGKNIYAVTGMVATGTSTSHTNGSFSGNIYNSLDGQLGSTTGNITGVYDMNGCVMEYVVGYINNTAGEVSRNTYGYSLTTSNVEARYRLLYAISSSSDKGTDNYAANLITSRYGDAIRETSTSGEGTTSWNSKYSYFPSADKPFMARGGNYNGGTLSGLFSFAVSDGKAYSVDGFRVCLINE